MDIITEDSIVVAEGFLTSLDNMELINNSSNDFSAIYYYNFITNQKKRLLIGRGSADVEYLENGRVPCVLLRKATL